MPTVSTCKHCGKEITWTVDNGYSVPLNRWGFDHRTQCLGVGEESRARFKGYTRSGGLKSNLSNAKELAMARYRANQVKKVSESLDGV